MTKTNKIIYWIATGLVAFGMTGSGISGLLQVEGMVAIITKLGYPTYLLYILGIWKILAAIAIIVPKYPLIKEWAYAGLFFVMTGATISHILNGDTFMDILPSLMQTIFIATSWYFRPADRKLSYMSVN